MRSLLSPHSHMPGPEGVRRKRDAKCPGRKGVREETKTLFHISKAKQQQIHTDQFRGWALVCEHTRTKAWVHRVKRDRVLFCHRHVSPLWEEVVWGPEGQDVPSVRVSGRTDQWESLYFCVCNRAGNSIHTSSVQRKKEIFLLINL